MTPPPDDGGQQPDDVQSLLRIGREALQPFQVQHGDEEFLVQTFCHGAESAAVGEDVGRLVDESLLAGAEAWHAVVDCARSLRQQHAVDPSSLDGGDILEFVWYLHSCHLEPEHDNPWHETDRLLLLAGEQQRQAPSPSFSRPRPTHPSPFGGGAATGLPRQLRPTATGPRTRPERKARHVTSHYWDPELADDDRPTSPTRRSPLLDRPSTQSIGRQLSQPALRHEGALHAANNTVLSPAEVGQQDGTIQESEPAKAVAQTTRRSVLSPYFAPSPPRGQQPESAPKRRPPRGTVSCIPFPPLDSPSFGLVQEKMAHEPFWLLAAVTFLIRTKGTAALPVFYGIKERFPTPGHIADPANAQAILHTIRHLGLGANRLGILQKYARAFVDNPPRAGRVYRVRNYCRRDILPTGPEAARRDTGDGTTGGRSEDLGGRMPTPGEEDGDGDGSRDGHAEPEAWEIGHVTQGKYAIDSWRIFCRDELLGRATDWNGGGSEAKFQPEWMRVMPNDKELRAYLRWMWMREGWEWDPETGDRVVLRPDLARAVNETRVEYDDNGGLTVVERPREL
ncbi:hypothetical protein GMORB2_5671 [Geosmithia morbida]|uniref:Uncharacterized protein n=1 Tax=Geosmithia morbida TaxID=1094350 RepID=A0A9P4YXP1_9HYPO|nr:uncharacterized protein GMORB2_5671 [Geosmithia morbida]KAF4123955.1 hypothetical protein GMORB2_5671 [Geosmithia morbida]